MANRVVERGADRRGKRRVHGGHIARFCFRPLRAQIHDVHVWQSRAARALGEGEQLVFSRRRVRPALETRRRTAKDHHGTFGARTHNRDLARVIARRLALLVARLVLFVHDDGAEVAQRGKNRGTRADDNALLPAAQREPRVVPLSVRERAVQHRNSIAEDGAKPIDGLRRQRNLRNEHDRRLSLLQHDSAQHLEVDERLAAPRHAVQQRHLPRLRERQPRDRVLLRRRWRVDVGRPQRAREKGITRNRLAPNLHEPARDEPPEHGRREVELLAQQLRRGSSAERLEELIQCALLRRA